MHGFAQFVFRTVLVGLVAGAVLLLFLPEGEDQARPVVEVHEMAARVAAIPQQGPVSYAAAVQRAAPAVVNIYTRKTINQPTDPFLDDPLLRRFFGDQFSIPSESTQTSLGSGVIVSPQGYILTSNHVIENADEIEVLLSDGQSATATVVGTDPETDLAVLRIDAQEMPSIPVGSSRDLQVGDVALAIGNPFGVGQTVTQGIVSATGRDRLGINTFENFIQTDAAINPGNSGGALINAYGELIGINTAIFSRSGGSHGIGFAIPVGVASDIMTQIIENGAVVRGWLGVEAQNVPPELASTFGLNEARGVLISGVMQDGPADLAGIIPGDILLEIEDRPVIDAIGALTLIARQQPGERVNIEGLRDGEDFAVQVEVSQRPPVR